MSCIVMMLCTRAILCYTHECVLFSSLVWQCVIQNGVVLMDCGEIQMWSWVGGSLWCKRVWWPHCKNCGQRRVGRVITTFLPQASITSSSVVVFVFFVFVFADSWASHHHISPTSIYHFVLRFCICIFICIFIVFSFVFAESWEGFRHISPISIYHFISF